MAEAVIVVCDDCGKPAEQTVAFKVGGRSFQKDLCGMHLAQLVKNARTPRRGRPRQGASKPAKTRRRTGSSTASGRTGGRKQVRKRKAR
jgi:hypothetical protein